MKHNLVAASLLFVIGMIGENGTSREQRREKPKKSCLVCGKKHQHNNSFCSPDCCKSYKKKVVL